MELNFLKKDKLDYLIANMSSNMESGKYIDNSSWVSNYLDNDFSLPSGIHVKDINLSIDPNDMPNTDLENSKIIYEAMKDISIQIATEPQIWIYLTHVTFWDYMRKRWPMEGKKLDSVKSRYFFTGNVDRALTTNGISRLWWIAHTTYDESYDDPYYLTKILLTTQDVAVTIFARNFSRNTNLTRFILKAIDEYANQYNKFPIKNHIRELAKDLNRIGGIKILDTLPYSEIKSIVFKSLDHCKEIGIK